MGEDGPVTSQTPADRRIVFLDVDGTYADRGVVPPEHVDAVRAARAAGHRVLLCTGRPKAMLPERILAAGFDGVVASAGAYVEIDGEVLSDLRFPADLADRAVAVLDTHDAAFILEAPDLLYGRPGVQDRLAAILAGHLRDSDEDAAHEGPVDIMAALTTPDSLSGCSFAKITYFGSAESWTVLAEEIGDEVFILPSSIPGMGDSSGEIHMTGVHKAVGVAAVIAHLGLTRDDVVAFGDGLNDLEMIEFAGTGVAIEGADPRVLAVATRTAPTPAAHGLVSAFAELNLI
jgi:Cof subfamily protein (haloacid dehalogenase superfamily)